MTTRHLLSLLALSALHPFAPPAHPAEPADPRLQQLLKRYPEADTNKDGILTMEEAQAHARTLREAKTKQPPKPPTRTPADTATRPDPTYSNIKYGPHARNVLDLWLPLPTPATLQKTPGAAAPPPGNAEFPLGPDAKKPPATPLGAAAPTVNRKPQTVNRDGSAVAAAAPLVVFIHGGGFTAGDKRGVQARMVNDLLAAGVAVMSINYRYLGTATLPEILRDCARAIQYIRHHAADYNIDPARIASYGGSAGAGTSLWLAFHPDLADPENPDPVLRQSTRLVAAASLNGQASYKTSEWETYLGKADFPGADSEASRRAAAQLETMTPAEADDLSMLQHITKDDPPVFLYNNHPGGPAQNRGHYVHHPGHSLAIKKRCDQAGVPATLFLEKAAPRTEGDFHPALRDFFLAQFKKTAAPAPALNRTDIEYTSAAGAPLKLDLSIPAGEGPFPAIIQVHGGGWRTGDKRTQAMPLFAALTKAGIAWFSINYRLAPAHKYPASSDDVDAAIRWVKAHAADYNIDPKRIALMGQSAGGHLVELAAMRAKDDTTRVAAVISFFGPSDLEKQYEHDPAAVKTYLGITGDTPEARKLMREASPAAHVRADLPPFLLLHGDSDRVVPFELSLTFQQKLRDAGVPCELIAVNRGIHGMRQWNDLDFDYTARVIAWLQKTLAAHPSLPLPPSS